MARSRRSPPGSTEAQLALFPELPAAARQRRTAPRTRYFFALWPDEKLRAALAAVAAAIPPGAAARAYRVRPERYHLTLAFLGPLSALQIEAAQKAGAAVRGRAFGLRLDRVGYFDSAHLAWIGPQVPPPELLRLKAALDRELLHLQLPVERAAFAPHLTCLRGLDDAPDPPAVALDWPVSGFALVRSTVGGAASSYRLLGRWNLDPADPAPQPQRA